MAQICSTTTYWLGVTTERFTISNSLINESTDLTITPNSGTDPGTLLDMVWLSNNFDMSNEYVFNEEINHTIDVPSGTAHVLFVIPSMLAIPEIIEEVFTSRVPLIEGLHYDIFQITDGTFTYDVYYLRDLTNFTFAKRRFTFDITIK